MPTCIPNAGEELVPASKVRGRYNVSNQTLWRWENNEKLGFPQPIRINARRYWRLAELQAFEIRQASETEAA
jgi:hypothetical protein